MFDSGRIIISVVGADIVQAHIQVLAIATWTPVLQGKPISPSEADWVVRRQLWTSGNKGASCGLISTQAMWSWRI